MFESILTPLSEKWQTLSKRDQNAALILVVALGLSIVVFGIILPINKATAKLNLDLDAATAVNQELMTLAPQALAESGTKVRFNAGSLNTEARRQAARFGVELQRFEPEGEFLKVWLEDARYPAVVQWLGGLESVGISHMELTMEDRPKPGFVSVRVTLGAL